MGEFFRVTPNLTAGHDDKLCRQIEASYEGMAHWAGSGPKGAKCRECRNWGDGTGKKQKAMERPCDKFRRMTGTKSKKVPRHAAACKYFEPNN